MWQGTCVPDKESVQFFWLMLWHENLENQFKSNFALMYYHNMPMDYLDNLPAWQYYTYIDLLGIELDRQELQRTTGNNVR